MTRKRFDTTTAIGLVETVGYPRLHGGIPATIALRNTDFSQTFIRDNTVTTGGGTTTADGILFDYPLTSVHPSRMTTVTGNRFHADGIYAVMQLGWFGLTPLLPKGTLDNAQVTDNTITGTAAFGIAALDLRFRVPRLSVGDLANTSNNNAFRHNDLSGFSPSKASLYLGPSTHDNSFRGDPHGPVVNLGTNNHIVLTP